jgi:hypothetical protein|tara:strand:- start:270 stop:1715 length:1446 start_codon:yes stop_codon:yes gene_type:complete
MKNIHFKVILLVAIIFINTSCSESALDTLNPNQTTETDFWITLQDAEAAIFGTYSALQSNNLYGRDIHRMETISDNGYNEFVGDGYLAISEGRHLINSTPINDFWTGSYRAISRANQIISNVPSMDIEEADKNNIVGEALTIRALMYLNLTTLYGDVPLLVNPLEVTDSNTPRTSVSDVRATMISDLQNAVNLLAPNNPGRINKGAAMALLGKYFLYEKDFPNASQTFAQVMTMGYSLHSDYATLFTEAAETSSEIVFSVKFANLPGEGNAWSEGYNGVRPLPNFVNDFEAIDGLPIDQSPLYNPLNPIDNRDPRLDVTVLRSGESDRNGVWDPNDSDTQYGYEKYVVSDFDTGTPQDFYVIRYADVLLMFAEAENEVSGPTQAVQDAVNAVRNRVVMPNVSSSLTKDQMREAIRHERRVELGFEGIRLFDVMRWGIAQDRYINGVTFHTRTFESPKHNLFPIPQAEVDNNGGITQNNTGW